MMTPTRGTRRRPNSPIRLEDIYDQNSLITRQNDSIKNEIKEINTNITKLNDNQNKLNFKVDCVESDVRGIREKQNESEKRINIIEQRELSNIMEIRGVQSSDLLQVKDIKKYVNDMLASFGIHCDNNDIEYAYVKKIIGTSQLDIIVVKLVSEQKKIDIMKKKFAYSKANKNDIYFDHALTPYYRHLYKKVRSVKNELNKPIVFFRNGKIYMKGSREEKPIIIYTHEDLEKIMHSEMATTHHPPPAVNNERRRQQSHTSEMNKIVIPTTDKSGVSNNNFLIFYQLNVRGLNDVMKFSRMKAIIECSNIIPDFMVLSEVKLKPSFPIDIYKINGYLQYSALRDAAHSKGGLLIYVKRNLQHKLVSSSTTNYELIIMDIQLGTLGLRVFCIYRPPDASNFKEFMNDIELKLNESHGKKLILLGDFNIDWLGSSSDTMRYRDLLRSFDLEVINDECTRPVSGKLIDHVVTNFHDEVPIKNITVEQDACFTDHSAIFTLIPSAKKKEKSDFITRRKINFDDLENKFCTGECYEYHDVDELALTIQNATKDAISRCSESVRVKVKNPSKIGEHVNAELLMLIKEKDKYRKKMMMNKDNIDVKVKYEMLNMKYKEMNNKLYTEFIENCLNKKDMRGKWRGLNKILGRVNEGDREVKEILSNDGNVIKDDKLIANKFNEDFCETMMVDELQTSPLHVTEVISNHSFYFFPTDECEVEEAVNSLKSNSAAGSDEISPKVVKRLKITIVPLLVCLINMIFTNAKFPDCFKDAIVRPVHKSGDKNVTINYRPISMLKVYAKIVEKIIYDRLYSYLEKSLFFYHSQHGFRRKTGTENAALEVVNFIKEGLNEGKKVSAIFIDLRKAFDLVNHDVLLQLLEGCGIRGHAHVLIKNYLNGRKQRVKVNNVISNSKVISCGVIQGSILGSLFFLIMINAIHRLNLLGKLVLYADDAVLLHVHDKNESISDKIINDMRLMLKFLANRKMQLNSNKTVFMIFKTNQKESNDPDEIIISEGCKIKKVNSFKYLGLHLDPLIKFNTHVKAIEGKISRVVGALWKLRSKIPLNGKKLIYSSLIHSHLVYMVPIWGVVSQSTINPIQVLQNRAIRNVYGLNSRYNRVQLFREAKILPVRCLSFAKIAEFVFKALKGLTRSPINFETIGGTTRQKNLLKVQRSKNNHGKLNMKSLGPKIFNEIPKEIANASSLQLFKLKIKNFILSSHLIETLLKKNFLDIIFR